MSLETKTNLNDSTIDGLQKLIRYNIDSFDGFTEAADEVNNKRVSTLFRELATERSNFANELQDHVTWNGDEAVDDGSTMAAVHRTWIQVRSALNGGDAYPILCEAERGEDYIKSAYEDVLKETAGSAVNDVLNRQYRVVKSAHDRVRDLRDQLKNA